MALLLPVYLFHFSFSREYASGREKLFNNTLIFHNAKYLGLGILDAQKSKWK